MRRKSQSALEFLTTYALAFVVIAIALSSLYYFGVFDFSKYLPQKCTFPSQFKCLDFSLNSDQVRLRLANNIGENICIKSMGITNDAVNPLTCIPPPPSPGGSCGAGEIEWVRYAENNIVFANCQNGGYISGGRAEVKVSFIYYAINTPSKPLHAVNGKINGRVTS